MKPLVSKCDKLVIHEASGLAIIPHNPAVVSLIPHARQLIRNHLKFLLVPAKKEELQLLSNLGYQTPSPLSIDYDWNGNVPFQAQVDTANMLIHSPRAYVLNEIGTGKTLAALFAFDYLRKHGLARKALVVAPLSCLTSVWVREVFVRMGHMEAIAIHGSAVKRKKLLAQDADIYVINHHGVATVKQQLLAMPDIDVVIIDELAVLRNHRTGLWKNINEICLRRKFVWGMTGSPTPRSPTDAWAQIKLLTPDTTTKHFTPFRDKVMTQLSQFRWIPKHNANDVVYEAMTPAVRYTRDDCVDLPPTTYSTLEVEHSPEQKKAYKQLMDKLYIAFKEGEVTAANEGVKVSKLLQICCGFAYTTEGAVAPLDINARMNVVKEVIDAAEGKVIVFVPFVETVKKLGDELGKQYAVATVWGGTSKAERDTVFNSFQHSKNPRVVVAHPQCMAHGLTLTSANTVIWYSSPMSLEIYEQANGRITRPGQKRNTHIIHIESSKLERKFYKKLEERAKTQGALLEMFEEED
jgi:SNF2 family DNA or RNA helicase